MIDFGAESRMPVAVGGEEKGTEEQREREGLEGERERGNRRGEGQKD
jgi:hypothetical protein